MNVLDVFNGDAFSVTSLTDSINKVPFIPGYLGSLGLFAEEGIATTSVLIEEENGILYLVENRPRGAGAKQNETPKRKARSLVITHLPAGDHIKADEIQNVREFGSGDQLKAIQNVVNNRLRTMSNSLDATLEHLRIGAVKGQILDADGTTVIYNLFTEFGVTQEDEIDFNLDDTASDNGVIRQKCNNIIRTMANNLGAVPFSGVQALCGDAFFDGLTEHPEVRKTFLNQQEAAELRKSNIEFNGQTFGSFFYGGITWVNYRGKVGSVDYINTEKVHFFPTGAPGLFKNYFGPADYIETVNTIGLPKYAKASPDMRFQKFVDLEAQSNPLPICTRPKVLMQGKRT